MARFGSVHALGYIYSTLFTISAESEPIWMKSGVLWVLCLGLAMADFGRNPCISDSWRARWNFVVFLSDKQFTISPISRRPNFTKCQHMTRWSVSRWKLSEQNF